MAVTNPRKLVPEHILAELAYKHNLGVPVTKLLKQYNLDCTRPTLLNLIKYYNLIAPETLQGNFADDTYFIHSFQPSATREGGSLGIHSRRPSIPVHLQEVIAKSLFPRWLLAEPNIQEAPAEYTYKGTFPYGIWQEQD